MAIVEESQSENVFTPDLIAGENARVHQINCEGGLGASHAKVDVTFCQSNYDPNQVQACVHQALSGGYVAVVGSNVAEGNSPVLLAQANMANVPAIGLELANFTANTTFNADVGALVAGGAAVVACKAGNKTIKEIRLNIALTKQVTTLENGALQVAGCKPIAQSVDMSATSTDVSPEVTSASQGADAVMLTMGAQNAAQVLKTRAQLGIHTPFVAASLELSADTLKSIGSAADGVIAAGWYPPGTPSTGESRFEADMAAISQTGEEDDFARAGWVAFDVLAAATSSVSTITQASVLQGLNSLTSFNAEGLMPTVNFSKPGPNPTFPRLVNLTVTPGVVSNEKIVANSQLPEFLPILGG